MAVSEREGSREEQPHHLTYGPRLGWIAEDEWGVEMAVVDERERFDAEEKLNDLFEPDTLLPLQYFAALKRKKFPSGEHRLLVAVIRDAIDCFQKHIHARDAKRRQLFIDADEWIANDEDQKAFSFNDVCETLGMNPDYVRHGLQAWRDRQKNSRRAVQRSVHARADVRIESPMSVDLAGENASSSAV